jgi:hypothetical protein
MKKQQVCKTNFYLLLSFFSLLIVRNSVSFSCFNTTLFANAFGFSGLTQITLPENVITISSGTFYDCKKLNTIIMKNNVQYIDAYAFKRCSSLTNVVLSTSLTTIGFQAFANSGLQNVVFLETPTYININTFLGCTALQTITMKDNQLSFMTERQLSFNTYSTINLITDNNNYVCESGKIPIVCTL